MTFHLVLKTNQKDHYPFQRNPRIENSVVHTAEYGMYTKKYEGADYRGGFKWETHEIDKKLTWQE